VTSKQHNPPKDPAVDDPRARTFLTEAEMKQFLTAACRGRHAARDYVMMLMTYRHGLRVSELVDLCLTDLDLDAAHLYVRRKKGSLSAYHPIEGDELRALRAWLRRRGQRDDAGSPYLFLSERGPMTRQAINYLAVQIGRRAQLEFHVHPQMLRDSTGYHLAHRNFDTKLLQNYLGHRNIIHTTKYRRTAAGDFKELWR
jgi:type 1 fimbriae regulatory protein FimB